MSNRNSRRAAPTAAVKVAKGRRASVASTSSTFDLSSNDNDNYSGVDEISDDEDDDEDDVFAAEEQAIMGEDTPSPGSTPRPQESNDEWFHDADHEDDDDDDFDEDNEESNSVTAHDLSDDSTSWAGIQDDVPVENLFEQEYDQVPHRRVRFNVPTDDSSSDSTEDDDHGEWYPDIFVDQSSLDPSFRRQIEKEQDESSASDSFWDHTALYHGDNDADSEADDFDVQVHNETNGSSVLAEATPNANASGDVETLFRQQDLDEELDGYETDGETTEEEDIPDPPIRRKSSPPPSEGEDSDSEVETPVRHRKDQPLVSRFNLDKPRKRPVAVFNTKTGKMMIFTPDRRRHLDLSPEQFRENPFGIDWSMQDHTSPLVGNGAGLTLDSFTSDLFMNPSTMDEFQDMFLPTADQSAASLDGESSNPRDSDIDPENGLKVSDFLDFDDESSNDEDDRNKTREPSSTPLRPTTASSDVDVLSHLNPATVGAFRRNQVNSQLLIRNQATQDSLDFSGPYNSTAIRGIKSDRFDTAGVPLTPARRHKRQPSDFTRSPLDAVSMKRKASSEASQAGHKKQKSISDVGSLQL